MKNAFLYSACAAALLVATPTLAGTPPSAAGNKSTIVQDGDTQKATVTQVGSDDTSIIDQGADATGLILDPTSHDNTATIQQQGIVGGKSIVTQGGFDNTAIVQSRDTAGLFVQGPPIVPTAPGTPPVTLSTITQSGDHNYAAIGQTSVSRTEQSVSGVTQINSGNKAYVNQADAGQSSTVLQTSGSNMAFVNQGLGGPGTNATTDNISLVNQIGEGGGSTATVEQDGTLDNSAVTQSGTADVAVVKQKDPNYSPGTSGVNDTANFSTVSQSGSSDRADVGQAGLHNTSTITELNTNNDANVSQAGTYNVSTVSQNAATGTAGYTGQLYGAIIYPYPQTNHNSMVIVRQVGDNLTSKTTENGAATFAFVNQVGMGETSTVTQTVAGSNNAAFVEQFGTGNTSSFVQTGSNNQSQPLPNTDVSGKLVGAKGIHQFGNANYSNATQSGNGGFVNVVQNNAGSATLQLTASETTDGTTPLVNNYSLVKQDGNGNMISVNQTGKGNFSEIDQLAMSASNSASVTQSSDFNESTVMQYGTNGIATVQQGN